MDNRVGFRFIPTDEEIVDYYLRLKNLGGSTSSHVDEAISTVDICKFEPRELPAKSRRESRDQVWYYFGRKENKYNRGERQSRKTNSGFWKKTGETAKIFRKRGNGEQIGEKRVLVFQSSGSKTKSDWAMHEYVATFLPPADQTTYTVCKVMFRGDPTDLPSSSASAGEVEQIITHMNHYGGSEGLQNPRHFTGLLDAEEETQIDDALRRAIDTVSTDDLNRLLNSNENDEKQRNIMFMQENRNDYRPKMSLTGVFIGHSDDDSDSDFISTTTTVSKTLETSLDTSDEKNNHYEDVQGTEMGEYEINQEVINNKRAGFFYRKIQSCIKKTLLCSSIPQEYDN
ncbi:hypothetical protein Bca101_055768 [Brassica carinata]